MWRPGPTLAYAAPGSNAALRAPYYPRRLATKNEDAPRTRELYANLYACEAAVYCPKER